MPMTFVPLSFYYTVDCDFIFETYMQYFFNKNIIHFSLIIYPLYNQLK